MRSREWCWLPIAAGVFGDITRLSSRRHELARQCCACVGAGGSGGTACGEGGREEGGVRVHVVRCHAVGKLRGHSVWWAYLPNTDRGHTPIQHPIQQPCSSATPPNGPLLHTRTHTWTTYVDQRYAYEENTKEAGWLSHCTLCCTHRD